MQAIVFRSQIAVMSLVSTKVAVSSPVQVKAMTQLHSVLYTAKYNLYIQKKICIVIPSGI